MSPYTRFQRAQRTTQGAVVENVIFFHRYLRRLTQLSVPATTNMPAIHHRLLQAENYRAPLHRLPDELLSLIFHQVILCFEWKEQLIVHELAAINSVCARWRNIALYTPELWSSILYQNMTGKGKHYHVARKRAETRIRTYLERSKQCAIDVYFHVSDNPALSKSVSLQAARFFAKTILPQLSQCRTLHLKFPTRAQLMHIFPLAGPLDRLRSFSCVGPLDMAAVIIEELPIAIFEDKTILQLVDFEIDSSIPLSTSNIDGVGLRSLAINGSEQMWNDTLGLISRASPLLQTLYIDLPFQSRNILPNHAWTPVPENSFHSLPLDQRPQLSLPNLRDLACDAGSLWDGFGTILEVPHITHATLDQFELLFTELEAGDEGPPPGFSEFSHLPSPKLLDTTPHLQYLTLSHVPSLHILLIKLLLSNRSIIMLTLFD